MVQYRMGTIDDLDAIYESYAIEFPENERKTKFQLKQLLVRGAYHLLIAEERVEVHNVKAIHRIGFACLYVPLNEDFIWLDYLVIERAYQSKGYGSKFFYEMMRIWSDRKGMFIEIEIPSGEDVNQLRRIVYYEKLGAKRLPINYHLPTEVDDMAMYLYFKPATILTSDNSTLTSDNSTLTSDNSTLTSGEITPKSETISLSQAYILKAISLANSTIHWDHANLGSVWQKNRFISEKKAAKQNNC